ncbi:MAG: hypothetical protein GKR99_07620 [Rhodobacteraceae bacterium]|nr:hypothetical protein [Paracoccaceae bacterium]
MPGDLLVWQAASAYKSADFGVSIVFGAVETPHRDAATTLPLGTPDGARDALTPQKFRI